MRTPPVTAAPDETDLHEAALRHLARYGTTVAGLIRVLDRRVSRWERAAAPEAEAVAAARAAVRTVADRLAASKMVDDAAFARARARRLTRGGRSRLAIAAHLGAHGVAADLVRSVVPEDSERELEAAVATARRRRIGPFRAEPADDDSRRRELGILGRAGFAQPIAQRVLNFSREDAEAVLARLRRP
jgi:regulatory protein